MYKQSKSPVLHNSRAPRNNTWLLSLYSITLTYYSRSALAKPRHNLGVERIHEMRGELSPRDDGFVSTALASSWKWWRRNSISVENCLHWMADSSPLYLRPCGNSGEVIQFPWRIVSTIWRIRLHRCLRPFETKSN